MRRNHHRHKEYTGPGPAASACLLLLLLVLAPASGFARDVTAIKSRELAPFQEAVEGFKSTALARVRTLSLQPERGEPDLEEALKDHRPDLVYALGAEALTLAANRFPEVPLVYSFVLDPGAITSQARSGRKAPIQGISMTVPPERQLKALTRIAPRLKRVGIVYDGANSAQIVARARTAARQHGLALVEQAVSRKQDAPDAIAALQGQADCILMLPDVTVMTPETVKYLLLFSFRNGMPLIGLSDKYVAQGALFALSFDSAGIGKQAGELATQLLAGWAASEDAMVDPGTLRLTINQKTAARFGIDIPAEALKEADQLF